ncbi:MAG: DUF1598 domain-containing protein [Planctomycetes bacterium]|nr:DUF1598 domain-containing protein [Planctomycetota bacterium]
MIRILTRGFLAGIALLLCVSLALGQGNGGNGGNGGRGGNGGNGGNAGGNGNFGGGPGAAGVEIDAEGVLRVRSVDPRIALQLRMATLQSTDPNTRVESPMRKVSLNRLERAVAQSLERNAHLDEEMLGLAGLTRIEYVFLMPDSNDIVIAGPAEKIVVTPDQRFVGVKSGKTVLQLKDLVVALRAYGPGQENVNSIGCSIDPTKEGIQRMQRYHSQFAGQADKVNVQMLTTGMRQALGYQNVTIKGIPRDTHFAQVLVEADYRMKLIGIGLEDPIIPMNTWIERLRAGGNAGALQRWYFEADYSKVATNEEGTALHLQGQGVKLTGEKEMVSKNGERTRSGNIGDPASRGFTQEFTQKFEKLGELIPVFGELRNLFDMSVAAAFIQDRNLYEKAGWDLGVFGDETKFQVLGNPTITQVESAVNAIWKDGQLVTPIGGGVHIAARKVIYTGNVGVDRTIDGKSQSMGAPADLADGQWWWD